VFGSDIDCLESYHFWIRHAPPSLPIPLEVGIASIAHFSMLARLDRFVTIEVLASIKANFSVPIGPAGCALGAPIGTLHDHRQAN
jgi:hypothetical protein